MYLQSRFKTNLTKFHEDSVSVSFQEGQGGNLGDLVDFIKANGTKNYSF